MLTEVKATIPLIHCMLLLESCRASGANLFTNFVITHNPVTRGNRACC